MYRVGSGQRQGAEMPEGRLSEDVKQALIYYTILHKNWQPFLR